jgi:protein-S-isoprenylcysteine O-methyltransferase Ste14
MLPDIPFELGLWNAWILVGIYIVVLFPGSYAMGAKEEQYGPPEKIDTGYKAGNVMFVLVVIGGFLYSIFLPLEFGPWFWLGLATYLVVLFITMGSARAIGRTPEGEVFSTGPYRYSRHPIYVSYFLLFVSLATVTLAWPVLVMAGVVAVVAHLWARVEETACLETLGEPYAEYWERTPRLDDARWNHHCRVRDNLYCSLQPN